MAYAKLLCIKIYTALIVEGKQKRVLLEIGGRITTAMKYTSWFTKGVCFVDRSNEYSRAWLQKKILKNILFFEKKYIFQRIS